MCTNEECGKKKTDWYIIYGTFSKQSFFSCFKPEELMKVLIIQSNLVFLFFMFIRKHSNYNKKNGKERIKKSVKWILIRK